MGFLTLGFEAEALSYDYSASIECLAHPQKPLYNGGIIQNPELNDGLKGWIPFGDSTIEHRESLGNKFVVAHSRNKPYDSVSQKIYLRKGLHYSLSAWIQVSETNVPITAVVKTTKGYKFGGAIYAEPNCWSMLKGGLIAETTEVAELYFEARKRKVVVQAVDKQGSPLRNASISLTMNRFTVTAFENEMKWYTNENAQGNENYNDADGLLQYAKKNNIGVRGHNIFWDDPSYQPSWINSLSPDQLNSAVEKRVNSIVARYKGQLIGWDVVNENLHFSFFENKLGQNFSPRMFNEAHNIDGQTTLFLNEYNTIEDSRDGLPAPPKYIQKIREIQSLNKQLPLGIGLESHFPNSPPNLPYMRASLDTLAATGLPIWITELDVASQPNQAGYFEQVLREAHSHPTIRGIVLWTAWSPQGCYRMCLTDNNFKNLPTGDVVDKLLNEWGKTTVSGTTDENGFLETTIFHGDYEMEISHPVKKNYTITHQMQVHEFKKSTQFIQLSI
ncbi:hypothetical protein TSUD_218210 [Trifolium subterraneum]|uniref:GH10 domain-containing protein n=1 Tax=Trifolium subterraneum TaxID=3900 RepID=A0A2Z6MS54_TRISU|nr:hypothetical protein TSUD_218210 [Trifolium subterraneum]